MYSSLPWPVKRAPSSSRVTNIGSEKLDRSTEPVKPVLCISLADATLCHPTTEAAGTHIELSLQLIESFLRRSLSFDFHFVVFIHDLNPMPCKVEAGLVGQAQGPLPQMRRPVTRPCTKDMSMDTA